MGFVQDGVAQVLDMYADENASPTQDTDLSGSDDVTLIKGSEEDGKTNLSFRVPLKTEDKNDFDFSSALKSTKVIFAMHKDSDRRTAKHERELRGEGTISLLSGKIFEDDGISKEEIHGILMAVSWGILIPLAVTISRFYKHIGHLWYQLHVFFMGMAVVCVIAAFALIVIEVEDDFQQSESTARAHAIIGLIVVILFFLQPLIGFYADHLWKETRTETPFWPDKVHWYIGRLSVVLSIVVILTGISTLGGGTQWYASYITVIILWVLFWVVKSLRQSSEHIMKVQHA